MMYLRLFFSLKNLIYIFATLHTISAYNLDTVNAKVFSNPARSERGSYFGFSVALFSNTRDSVVLVGAPRANTSVTQSIIEPGTVYQCSINDTCKEWAIDNSENGWHKRYPTVNQIKDNAWIGATIAVENKTDPRVVVCGPRWKNNVINRNRPSWFMNGICYWTVANDVDSFRKEATNEIIPLISISQQIVSQNGIGIYNYGMGETGFSLHMTSNDLQWDLVIGSPGIFNWKGTPILVRKPLGSNIDSVVPLVRDERRVHGGDYFGYSVTSGCYFKSGDLWFASGAPRASNLKGNVLIFAFPSHTNRRLEVKSVVDGEQHGEYFGAAITSCDLNNDGKEELIVGAPQWSKDMDEGRIYVFTGRDNNNFDKQTFDGEVIGGKFGSTVTCLGDIDYDGHGDIAVGAPYAEETGAIYIFNGYSNGLPKRYSQKVIGSIFGQDVRGFGISISEPRDVNGDNYLDVAVGAYLGEKVVLFKSKPVVTVATKLSSIERKRLLRNSTLFFVDVCTSYAGVYAPDDLRIVKILKVDPMYGRAMYSDVKSSNNTYLLPETLRKSNTSCERMKINLKEDIQNVIDPLEISISVILKDTEPENGRTKTDYFTSSAIINKLSSKTDDLIKMPFAVDCGEDDICTSDVRITLSTDLKSDNRYVIGSTSTIKLLINSTNNGEPAYQAKVYTYIPEILSLAIVPPECMEGSLVNNTLEVICDIGNPLRNNRPLTLELDASEVRFNIDSVDLWTNFTTQSEDKNLLDNLYNLTIYFDVDVDIAIAGKAQEDLYSYFHNDGKRQLDFVRFQHVYEVQKFGNSPIEDSILTVNVPVYWKDSTGDVQIVNINQTTGYIDGQQFDCILSNYTSPTLTIHKFDVRPVHANLTNTHERFTIEENPLINLPPENRSVYINCTNAAVKCVQLNCKLSPLISTLSVAKLSLTLDLQLLNFPPNMMEGKDIVFFLSEGNVNIIQPYNVTQKFGHKPDSTVVATTFLGSPIAERIAMWIIVLSVILGLILLILIVLGLIKLGFFNRKKKIELEALKAETDDRHGITLETSSSKEALDGE